LPASRSTKSTTISAVISAKIGHGPVGVSRHILGTWDGLVPKQSSSGGKEKLGSISNEAIGICAACLRPARWL
jgi:transposase